MKTEEEMEKDYYAKQAESYKAQLEQIQKNYDVLLKVFFCFVYFQLNFIVRSEAKDIIYLTFH